MQHPVLTMPTFPAQVVFSFRIFIEAGTPFNHFFHSLRTFLHHNFYDLLIAQPGTGDEGVDLVLSDEDMKAISGLAREFAERRAALPPAAKP